MIRPVTSADRAVLRELLAEFYDTDAVLHPLPASYHDAALDELFRSDSLQRACLLEQDGETAGLWPALAQIFPRGGRAGAVGGGAVCPPRLPRPRPGP